MAFPSRSSVAFLLAVLPLGLVGACGDSTAAKQVAHAADAGSDADAGPEPPPRICKTPGPPSTPWFETATADFGVAASADFEPVGNCIISADFDNDGYADVIVLRGESQRGLVDGKPARFLLMNRPSPTDPSARVLENVPDMGGLMATRDGTNDRGMSNAYVGDLNNDGAVDVILCPSDFNAIDMLVDPCAAFLNDGKAHFTLAAADIDTDYPHHSAVLVDYDRDGILDFFAGGMAHWPNPSVLNWHYGPRLFKGNGDGTFTDVSVEVGLPQDDGWPTEGTSFRPTMGATACDLDDDGDLDIVMSTYGREPNQVYRNDAGHFVEVGHELGLDHDDREDFSDDESYRCYCQVTGKCSPMPPAPKVTCNTWGNPYFRGWYPGQTDQPWMLGGNNMGVTCFDADDDGDMDVMFATIVHGDTGTASDPTELILNPGNGGKFTRPGNDVTGLTRPKLTLNGNYGDHMVTLADLDLNGRKDVWVASIVYPGSRPWFWRQNDDGKFEEMTTLAGIHALGSPEVVGVNFTDLDGDGDLDYLTAEYSGAKRGLKALRNRIGQDSNFVRIKLVGKGKGFSNGAGIGARVRVTAGGRTQTQEVKGGQGLSNVQNDLTLTFGLGSTCDIDAVEVRWPDAQGSVTKYEKVSANYTVVLREGEAAPEYR